MSLRNEVRTPETGFLVERLGDREMWRLRAAAFGELEGAAAQHLHAMGYRIFFAMRSGGKLAGALGVGHKDGRVPLSTEDEALLTAVMAQAGLAYENARLYGALADRLEEIPRRCSSTRRASSGPCRSASSSWTARTKLPPRIPPSPSWSAETRDTISWGAFLRRLPGIELGPAPRGTEDERSKRCSPVVTGSNATCAFSVSILQGEPDRRSCSSTTSPTGWKWTRGRGARAPRLVGILAEGVAHESTSRRGAVVLREIPRGDAAGRSALRDLEEDGAANVPRRTS